MTNDLQERVVYYNKLVGQYEQLDAQIRALLSVHGRTDQLREDKLISYRELARQRDELYSEMRSLEQELFSDE